MSQHNMTPLKELCIISDMAVWKLKHDSIEEVKIEINNTTRAAESKGPYTERATGYMIRLCNQKKWRRVYATPLGNVSSLYIKVYNIAVVDGIIYCETALDDALYRAEDD